MKLNVKIDKLCLSVKNRGDVLYPFKAVPGYRFSNYVSSSTGIYEIDSNRCNYKKVVKYKKRNGNLLFIFNLRKKRKGCAFIAPLYVVFLTGYYNKINYQDVYDIEQFFMKICNTRFRISKVDLALDIISKKQINLYEKVIRTVKPGGRQRYPSRIEPNGIYFGIVKGRWILIIYDKTKQMKEKHGIDIDSDVTRAELRLKVPQLKNFVLTIDDLATYDWSDIYGKYYSFHRIKPGLKSQLRSINEPWRQPLWDIRDIMENRFNKTHSNFYRDCLTDHPMAGAIRTALANFKWGS